MQFHNFEEIESYVLSQGIVKTVALCGAHDEPALSALVDAKRRGVVKGILIGDEEKVRAMLADMREPAEDYTIMNLPEETESAKKAVELVREGKADIPMKGLMQTSSYMRAILNKETGILPAGKTLSQTTVFEYPAENKLMFITDCGINISPDLEAKKKILMNAVELTKCFGLANTRVAVLSALEVVNPKIPSTVDGAELMACSERGEFPGCVVEGPYALDNAVSMEAAAHKGITGRAVAGQADVLLVPDLCAGNILHKSIHYFAGLRLASTVCGTEHPVVLTSRADTPDSKYNSILVAILQSL